MATLTQTAFKTERGAVTATTNTLTASDTFSYVDGAGQILILENNTAGSLTATITGSGATTISPDGYGGTVSVAGGYAIVVGVGVVKAVNLDKISAYLVGTITVTGATGAKAWILN